jgi:hypothetical protein
VPRQEAPAPHHRTSPRGLERQLERATATTSAPSSQPDRCESRPTTKPASLTPPRSGTRLRADTPPTSPAFSRNHGTLQPRQHPPRRCQLASLDSCEADRRQTKRRRRVAARAAPRDSRPGPPVDAPAHTLGVEEQFYLVWPLLLALVAIAFRRPQQRLIAIGLLAGTGIALSVWRLGSLWGGDPNRAYLGTDSRIFEPLTGALLAVLMTSPRVRSAIGRAHWPLVLLGTAGLGWGPDNPGWPGWCNERVRAWRRGGGGGERDGSDRCCRGWDECRDAAARPGPGCVSGAAVVRHLSVALAADRVDGFSRLVGSHRSRHAVTGLRADRGHGRSASSRSSPGEASGT